MSNSHGDNSQFMIDKKEIEGLLNTNIFGKYLYIFEDIDSTNNFARKLAKEGAPEGTVVLADYQTAGRGRLDHSWQSERAKNLLISIILRPQMDIETVQRLTLATADLLIEMLTSFLETEKCQVPQFSVKWPNDLLVGSRKMAGILTESALKNKKVDYAIVGIGLNANQSSAEFTEDLKESATSIFMETGRNFKIEQLAAALLNQFEKTYFHLECTDYKTVIDDWKNHCDQIGKSILIETPEGEETGIFKDVNESGRLVYQSEDGEVKELIAGSIVKVQQ